MRSSGFGGASRLSVPSSRMIAVISVSISRRASTRDPPVLALAWNGADWSAFSSVLMSASVSWAFLLAVAPPWRWRMADMAAIPSSRITASEVFLPIIAPVIVALQAALRALGEGRLQR